MSLRANRLVAGAAALAILAGASSALAQAAQPDADMQAVLDAQASLHPKPIETLTAAEARRQPTPSDGVKIVLANMGKSTAPDPGVSTKDVTYPGAAGPLPARIYVPAGASMGSKPLILYIHGGGWVIADIDTYDATPRALAKMTGAIVVSIEYRHAPEHKFPAAHDDANAAYKWVLDSARAWGADPKRIAIAGESAGGNLAINVAVAARKMGWPAPRALALIYPVAGKDMNTPSYIANANAKPLSKPMMMWFVQNTVRTMADVDDPRINLLAADLRGLPPTVLVTDQIDPLMSEGAALADKLKASGVKVDYRNYDGVTHEFFGMGAVVAKAKDAEGFVSGDLSAWLAK